MMKKLLTLLHIITLLCIVGLPGNGAAATEDLIVLCYHDIPKKVDLDDYGVDRRTFIDTIEYFRRHGFSFVSLQDIIDAHEGDQPLPAKAILLTFDDAYRSYYDFVYPLLTDYEIPSLLAIVSKWIDGPVPESVKHEVMTWEEIKEVSKNSLVEIVSHSHDLHKGVIYNPQGNKAAAAVSRVFSDEDQAYEDSESYRQRIKEDIKMSKKSLEENLGITVRAVAWPYGRYNYFNAKDAKALGIEINFALNDKKATVDDLTRIERYLIYKNPTLKNLLQDLDLLPKIAQQKRIVQVDMDWVHDPDPEQTEINLGKLLDRIKAMGVTTVYLQAFSDADGSGNISSVYFPNDVLPMKADLFNRVAHQLSSRTEVEVYAWLPMMSITLPNEEKNERLRVREKNEEGTHPSSSWYHRLSPFSDETIEIMKSLYEDVAAHTSIAGIIFQDDGYLNDHEDYHPDARLAYKSKTGKDLLSLEELTDEQKETWTQIKIDQINHLAQELMAVVKKHRPNAKFARTFYAPILTDEKSGRWLAQSYADSLNIYDYLVIMAYPYMEEVKKPDQWLRGLVNEAKNHAQGLNKTVFKIQTYDWIKSEPIDSAVLDRWLKTLVAEGALHLAYYPDDFLKNHPDADTIRMMMSAEAFPFKREWK